ncbi:MAG: sulfurtransferase [Pseudomonadales bacterium]|jgi:thiosulfate/3-mercaptopyruvate sulfurtransferase|nr:sulfurtransferase [Pseudomonadales bacterium]
MFPLIGVMELAETAADQADSLLLFDCRAALGDLEKGRHDFEAGHIPGAVHADLDRDLSSPPGDGGRHPLPVRAKLEARFQDWGVSSDCVLVCYDQNNGAFAGRFWWLARWLGHENVRVLDGGLDAWVSGGNDLETECRQRSKGNFSATEPLTRSCELKDVLSQEHQLLDARDAVRFRGEQEPIDPVAGHIPGAVCVPFSGNLSDGHFKSAEDLDRHFRALGLNRSDDLVCYCGSGVTAIHNILALKIAGYPEPALYAGSWSEWIRDPERPVATGD